jgi:CRISPR type III-associated protein (TIGR04423 family)
MNIEKSKYQGYIWYSNENKPRVFDGNELFELELKDGENPFVTEGFLCDGNMSISIKYIDGHYIVKQFNLAELPQDYQECEYQSNKMNGRWLQFRQYWRPCPDGYCLDMDVLQPSEFVFIGFNDKKKGE